MAQVRPACAADWFLTSARGSPRSECGDDELRDLPLRCGDRMAYRGDFPKSAEGGAVGWWHVPCSAS